LQFFSFKSIKFSIIKKGQYCQIIKKELRNILNFMANPSPNLQNLKPAQKGDIRNPNGAPKYKLSKEALKELLLLKATKDGKDSETLVFDVLHQAQIKLAANGNTRAYSEIMNRIEGKPIERISVTSTHEDQLLALSDEEKSEVFLQLKELQRAHGILDTVELEVFEELETRHIKLLQKVEYLEARHNEQLEKLRLNGLD